ncbi:hypothetical protein ACFX2J_012855 [Malus domestica]
MEALTKNELTVAVGFVIFTVVIYGVGAWTGEMHGRVDVCGDSVVEPEDHVLEGAEWHRRCSRVIGGMHAWCDLSITSMSTAAILGVVAQALSSLIITPMSFRFFFFPYPFQSHSRSIPELQHKGFHI